MLTWVLRLQRSWVHKVPLLEQELLTLPCIQVHYRFWFVWGSCCSFFSFLCRSLLVFCAFCFWPFYCLSYSSYMFRIFKLFIEPNTRMMLSQNKAKLRNKAQKIWTITGLNMIIKIYGWSSFKVKSQYEIAYISFLKYKMISPVKKLPKDLSTNA